MYTSAILLAAGGATRMGADKLQLLYKGRRLIDRALAPLVDSPLIDEVVVVVRPDGRALVDASKCRVVVNPEHQEGLGASLRVGAAAADAAADALVVSLADMPEITVEIVARLIHAFRRAGRPILVPVHQQRNGHPVLFGRACRGDLLRLGGDLGARQMIRDHPELVEYFPAPNRAVVYDMDTLADIQLQRLVFEDATAFRQAAAALEHAGVYFERADAAGGGQMAIGYYAFDEDQVAALCRGGRRAQPTCRGRC